jgi:hypothetical protein
MSWMPSDLVTDADLLAYERTILSQHGASDWQQRRQKVLEDWLWPRLRRRGLSPERFRTRFVADAVLGSTSSVFTDYTDAASNTTADDLNLATILAASSDYLAIGSSQQFRGVSLRMVDSASSVAATLSVELWLDTWAQVAHTDSTQATSGKPFSKGGSIIWTPSGEWVLRTLNSSDPLYFARLKLSAAPTGATLHQMAVIRRSVLCAPATLKTLALIFREAPTQQDGPWIEKAEYYEREAEHAYVRAEELVGGEFDTTDPPDDVVDATEQGQTTDQVGGPFRWERA